MRKSTLYLPVALLAWLAFLNPAGLLAQNDSTWIDAGTVKLKKGFTQTISIKGEDLERTPMTNLAQAINVWLNGAYTNPNNLIYVIDGVARQDVNAYSVYDIEEVIFVQNALVQLNGVAAQQQLLLIRTRRKNPGGAGLTFAAKENFVGSHPDPLAQGHPHYNTAFFHEYFVAIDKERKKVRYGISANFLHDPYPNITDSSIHYSTPLHLNRVRVNGYVDLKADAHNEFVIRAGYTTQDFGFTFDQMYPATGLENFSSQNSHQHIIAPSGSWLLSMGGHFGNELTFSYVSNTLGSSSYDYTGPAGTRSAASNNSIGQTTQSQEYDHWIAREHFSYHLRSGGWQITPAVDLSYQHARQDLSYFSFNWNSTLPQNSGGKYFQKGGMALLAPSLDASYLQVFDIHAGVLYNPSATHTGFETRKIFPFASLSADLLAGREQKRGSSLKLFASLAMSPNYQTADYTLGDFYAAETSLNYPNYLLMPAGYNFGVTGTVPVTFIPGVPTTSASYWTWQAGATLSSPEGKFEANYNFSRNSFPIPVLYPQFEAARFSIHRLGLLWKITDDAGFRWRSGINISHISGGAADTSITGFFLSHYGEITLKDKSWTGGWVNRVEAKRLFFALDLLYHLSESNQYATLYPALGLSSTLNALSIQDVSFGVRLHMHGARVMEVYLNAHDLWQSRYSDISDPRTYYGVGAKLGL